MAQEAIDASDWVRHYEQTASIDTALEVARRYNDAEMREVKLEIDRDRVHGQVFVLDGIECISDVQKGDNGLYIWRAWMAYEREAAPAAWNRSAFPPRLWEPGTRLVAAGLPRFERRDSDVGRTATLKFQSRKIVVDPSFGENVSLRRAWALGDGTDPLQVGLSVRARSEWLDRAPEWGPEIDCSSGPPHFTSRGEVDVYVNGSETMSMRYVSVTTRDEVGERKLLVAPSINGSGGWMVANAKPDGSATNLRYMGCLAGSPSSLVAAIQQFLQVNYYQPAFRAASGETHGQTWQVFQREITEENVNVPEEQWRRMGRTWQRLPGPPGLSLREQYGGLTTTGHVLRLLDSGSNGAAVSVRRQARALAQLLRGQAAAGVPDLAANSRVAWWSVISSACAAADGTFQITLGLHVIYPGARRVSSGVNTKVFLAAIPVPRGQVNRGVSTCDLLIASTTRAPTKTRVNLTRIAVRPDESVQDFVRAERAPMPSAPASRPESTEKKDSTDKEEESAKEGSVALPADAAAPARVQHHFSDDFETDGDSISRGGTSADDAEDALGFFPSKENDHIASPIGDDIEFLPGEVSRQGEELLRSLYDSATPENTTRVGHEQILERVPWWHDGESERLSRADSIPFLRVTQVVPNTANLDDGRLRSFLSDLPFDHELESVGHALQVALLENNILLHAPAEGIANVIFLCGSFCDLQPVICIINDSIVTFATTASLRSEVAAILRHPGSTLSFHPEFEPTASISVHPPSDELLPAIEDACPEPRLHSSAILESTTTLIHKILLHLPELARPDILSTLQAASENVHLPHYLLPISIDPHPMVRHLRDPDFFVVLSRPRGSDIVTIEGVLSVNSALSRAAATRVLLF